MNCQCPWAIPGSNGCLATSGSQDALFVRSRESVLFLDQLAVQCLLQCDLVVTRRVSCHGCAY